VSRPAAVARALLGWTTMFVALGVAIAVTERVAAWFGSSPTAQACIQGFLVTAIVVPVILLLRRRLDRRTAAGLGWARPVGVPLLVGSGVALATAAVVWGPALAAGWISVDRVDPAQLLLFLAVNTIIIVSYEALPEELALRGYAWTNLRDGWGPLVATVGVTALFPLGSLLSSATWWLAGRALGGAPRPFSLLTQDTDPLVYAVQLVLFGLALIAARRLPLRGALFVAIAFHAVHLTVNRVVLGGTSWLDAGVTVTLASPDVLVLVLVTIVLSGVVFVVIRKTMERRGAADRAAARG